MTKKIYAIFVAGGVGVRMGAGIPKQFLDLNGEPILLRTVRRFVQSIDKLHIIVALPKEHIEHWKEICRKHRFDESQILVEGGITRFHSVKNALAKVPEDAIVLIHDGVRPLVSAGLLHRLIEKTGDNCGIIPVTPVTDTLKYLKPSEKEGEFVCAGQAPDRSSLFGAQTPQAFPARLIKEAYGRTAFDNTLTDDASVAELNNIPLTYIIGEKYNIKITTGEDLELARLLY